MQLDPDDPLSDVLTINQAAAEVDRAPATLRDWIRKGRLPTMRIPGSRRVYVTGRAVREAERTAWENTPQPVHHRTT